MSDTAQALCRAVLETSDSPAGVTLTAERRSGEGTVTLE